ncbi:MAG: hypothetical protein HUJ72_01830 [Blautia sp.]|nr:hypothetical protein [Blautia sp.]
MNRKKTFGWILLLAVFMLTLGMTASAAQAAAGAVERNGNTYYIESDGSKACDCFRNVDGKWYYFDKKGKLYKPDQACAKTYKNKIYYFYKDGHVATGKVKWGKKYFVFGTKGDLLSIQDLDGNVIKNKLVSMKSDYCNIDSKGKIKLLNKTQIECYLAARDYIKTHTSSKDSNAVKLRKCYNSLMVMRFVPGHFPASYDFKILDGTDGYYKMALSYFKNRSFGNCHRFATCVAVIAKVLRYPDPKIVTIANNHSYVIIGGRYYDNMNALFGATYDKNTSYKIRSTCTL